jgi:hypothetical protein
MNELSPAQREAYARAKTSVVDLFAFELRHSTFPEPIRMIAYDLDVAVPLEETAPVEPGETVTFMGVAFRSPAENIDTEPGNTITVTVDGISAQALPYLNVANETLEPIAATIRYVAFDTRDSSVIGVSRPTEMQVMNFRTNILSLQMTLGFTNLNSRTLDV